MADLDKIISQFHIEGTVSEVKPFGSGLINDTYKVKTAEDAAPDYILQKINHNIFQDVDMLFVPVGETFTLPLSEVRRFIELVNPNIIVPMHYRVGGLSIPISPLDDFLDMIPEEAVDYIGNEIDVTREDIDGMMKECWVFDR